MKKIIVMILILALVLALGVGCSKDDSKKKLVSSRPVKEDPSVKITQGEPQEVVENKEPAAPAPTPSAPEAEPEPAAPTPTPSPAGNNDCDKLSGGQVGAALGGSWIKADDCPKNPVMPKGVSVCQCNYQWTTNFLDIETQTYTEGSEDRVFNMYCSSSNTEVGDKSCRWESPTGVQFVYFLKGTTFTKVGCRGTMCDMDKVATLAGNVANTI